MTEPELKALYAELQALCERLRRNMDPAVMDALVVWAGEQRSMAWNLRMDLVDDVLAMKFKTVREYRMHLIQKDRAIAAASSSRFSISPSSSPASPADGTTSVVPISAKDVKV